MTRLAAECWDRGLLVAQGAFLGCLCPFQQPRHLLCKHSGPHTQWFPPAWLASQTPCSTSSLHHCPSLWRGAVWQALEGGPGPGPFLQGRKGLLGWLGMQGRMNGHADEMLMNLGQDSPAVESWELPHPSPREGLTRPPLPHLWAQLPAPPLEIPWVERAAHRPPALALHILFLLSGTPAWWAPLLGVWPSTVRPLPQGIVTAHLQWRSGTPAEL